MKEFFGGSQLSQFMDQTNPRRADLEAAPQRARPRRPVARARRVRRPRRAPQPLRPHLPDRDARRSEHRPDRLARHVRPDQQLRLHRDAVPQGRTVGWDDANLTSYEAGSDLVPRTARSSSRRATRSTPRRRLQEAEGQRLPIRRSSPPTRSSTCPRTRRRSTSSRRPTRRSTTRVHVGPPSRRYRDTFPEARPNQIEYMDVSPKQVVPSRRRSSRSSSTTTPTARSWVRTCSARPCRFSSPSRRSSAPAWRRAAADSGQVLVATAREERHDGVTAERIRIETDAGELDEYKLQKFVRSNQGTCINQRPIVDVGARPRRAADRRLGSTEMGELALGRNILVAFMSWEGRQLRGRDRHQRPPRARTTCSPASTSRSTRSSRATPSSGPKRSPATSRTSARSPSRTSTRKASSTSAPRSAPATSWSARSRPRARPS